MFVNISTLLLQFEKCIVDDICDAGRARFFTFPRRGPQTKGLVKSADFPTQFECPRFRVLLVVSGWNVTSLHFCS